MHRIGYFIPEFPGQTHIFFWREYQALKRLGIQPELVSTRRPPPGIVSHNWSDDAIRHTTYLFPPSLSRIGEAVVGTGRAGSRRWLRCLSSIARAHGFASSASLQQRARLLGLAVMGASLAEIARRNGWTHVHCHSCADAAHIALFAHLLSGLSYSLTLHGPLVTYGPNQREKWRHATLGIVITERLRAEVGRDLAGALPQQLAVAPMGVDTERFRRRQARELWGGKGPFRIFSCGRLNLCKGHRDLAEAIALLRAEGIDARLVIAGEDDAGGMGYRKTLEAEIRERGVADCVVLLGAVDEDRIIRELQQAHVFALASHAEPLGVAIMEAMAMEIPVVVTTMGGVEELVQENVDGLFVPPMQPVLIANALKRVAQDPELALRLGDHGRYTILEKFQASRSAEVLAKHIQERAASS